MSSPRRRRTDSLDVERHDRPIADLRVTDASARVIATSVLLVIVAVIGWIDYITGPEIAFTMFYMLPVVVAAWYVGRLPMFVVAFTSGVVWFIADFLWRERAMYPVSSWNGITRLATFLILGWLVTIARADRDELRKLNARLNEALDTESTLARTDSLTGLFNARGFTELLDQRLRTEVPPFALLYVDLDEFKRVNDIHGHSAGDRFLQEVASLIVRSVREGDIASRLGGDEFAVFVERIEEAEACSIAQRIIEGIGRLSPAYPGTAVGASIGIALFRGTVETADSAIHEADAAMYRAKQNGKGRVEFAQSA